MVKAHLQARRRARVLANQHKVLAALDIAGEQRGQVERAVDLAREAFWAIVHPRQRQFDSVAPPPALQRQVGQIPHLAAGALLLLLLLVPLVLSLASVEQVRRIDPVRAMEHAHVRAQQERARHGHVHHLVRIDRHAVRELDAAQPAAAAAAALYSGKDDGPAPRRVDMQPEPLALAHGADFGQRVIRAEHGGSRGGVDVERGVSLGAGAGDERGELGGQHAACGVDGDEPDGVGAEAGDGGGLFDAVVTVGRGEDDEALGGVAGGLGGGEEVAAGGDEAGEVACAAAGAGDAAGKRAVEAKEAGEALGGEFLEDGEGRGDGVDMDVCVEGGEEELRGEADGGRGRVELVEEALVPGVDGVSEEVRDGVQQALLAVSVGGREEGVEDGGEAGRGQGRAGDEGVGGGRAGRGTAGAERGGGVCRADEGDYEGLDGVDELGAGGGVSESA